MKSIPVKRIFKPIYGLGTLYISQDIDGSLRISGDAERLAVSIPDINLYSGFMASVESRQKQA